MLLEESRRGMGTRLTIHLAISPKQADAARLAIDACFAWLAEVEACLTRFDARSELSQLNAGSGTWRPVSDMLFTVVEQTLLAARASDGLFDPTLLNLLEDLGYDRDFAAIAHREVERRLPGHASDDREIAASEGGVAAQQKLSGAWRHIKLDHKRRRIFLPRGVKIDLGGIAKGWAADVALERCFAEYPNVIVDIGGDLRVRGEKADGEPWPIGIGAPRMAPGQDEPAQTVVTLRHGAVATSGAVDRWWYRDGHRQHHLLDPRARQPMRLWTSDSSSGRAQDDDGAPLLASATALARTAAQAEVAAKVALLRGYPLALRAVETAWERGDPVSSGSNSSTGLSPDAGVALVLIAGTGEVAHSSNLRDYLDTLGGGGQLWLS